MEIIWKYMEIDMTLMEIINILYDEK